MKTAHEIVRDFINTHNINLPEFNEYARDNKMPEDELNIYDSRYLAHLKEYVDYIKESS